MSEFERDKKRINDQFAKLVVLLSFNIPLSISQYILAKFYPAIELCYSAKLYTVSLSDLKISEGSCSNAFGKPHFTSHKQYWKVQGLTGEMNHLDVAQITWFFGESHINVIFLSWTRLYA